MCAFVVGDIYVIVSLGIELVDTLSSVAFCNKSTIILQRGEGTDTLSFFITKQQPVRTLFQTIICDNSLKEGPV